MANLAREPDARVDLAGLVVTAFSLDGLVDRLVELASGASGGPPATVCYVNAHIFNLAWADAQFRRDLQQATLLWPDGVAARAAMRLARVRVPRRLSGLYFINRLTARLCEAGHSQFLLGSCAETVSSAADRLRARFGRSAVAGFHHGHFDLNRQDELIDQINASAASVLTVGMGSPRQERWIIQARPRLRPRLLWTVGALFDFLGGRESAAPAMIRSAGLEWLWRLAQDWPGKWRRYLLGNPLFLARMLLRPPRRVS